MLPLFVFLLLSSSWGFFLASAAHAHLNNASDERALMAFRATLSLDPNMALRSWNTSVPLCSWTGVQCSLRHQRVVSLNLTGMSLHGPISPLLANLSFLRVLDLSNNSHYGSIPHDLGRLFRLRVLRLSKNQLEGPIPSTIGSCRLLELVSLSHNFLLNGSIPSELGLLRNLKYLWLGINKLTGSIPTSFGNMSSLKNLSLGANQLHGSIPSELGRLSRLNTLYLRHNYLSGKIPPSLSNCTLLVDLQLHDNQLTGHIPWEFGGRLSQLENLFLWGNKLGGEIPKTLANCTHLRVLDLKINQLTGMVPVQLGQLFRLERLFLGGNQLISGSSTTLPILTALTNCSFLEQIHIGENHLTGTIPSSIQQLSRLSVFNLSHNEIGGKIPPEIGKLANLTYLNLEWNIFNGSIPSTLGRLQKLERLYLGKNKLRGSIPTEIGGIQRLGLLSLSQNKLSGQIPHSLGQLKQLRELYLDQNNLSGNISPNIGDCLRLEVLDLSNNRFNGNIPRTVAGLPNLQFFFNLSSNLLEGPLPLEISKMTMVQEINVAVNRLTGSVPSELESCTEVNYLNLSWNSFDGPIPDSLGKLVFLEDLDFSENNLSGTIPMSLENLKMLHHLNFSFNKLKGEVPKGGIFRRLRSGAFMENLGLCGQWVELPPCPSPIANVHNNHWLVKRVIISVGISVVVIFGFLIWQYCKGRVRGSSRLQITEAIPWNSGLPRISQEEIISATNGFSDAHLLGVGSFGSVYKGVLNDGTLVAIKVLNLQNEEAHRSFISECNALRKVRHRNLIKVITCCSNFDIKALVFPYMENGSLEKWLYPGEDVCRFSFSQRLQMAIDIAQGLIYLHHQCFVQVVHCDLKPSNVLLGDDMTAYIADFGIARLIFANDIDSVTSAHILKGSIGYIAPEYGLGENVSTKGDVYSYGIVLLEILTRKKPTNNMFVEGLNLPRWITINFPNKVEEVVDNNLLRKAGDDTNELPIKAYLITELVSIGLLCTQESPQKRPNMIDIMSRLERIREIWQS